MKSRIAIVGPIPPMQTGVATYVSELISALDFKDLDIHIEFILSHKEMLDLNLSLRKFGENQIKDVGYFCSNYESYDAVIYNIGNSPYHETAINLLIFFPGLVVLHDVFLDSIYRWKDSKNGTSFEKRLIGVSGLHKNFNEYQINDNYLDLLSEIFAKTTKIVVHSEHARDLIQHNFKNMANDLITVLKLYKSINTYSSRQKAIGDKVFNITSFGFIDDSKFNLEILKSFKDIFLKYPNAKLNFVGQNEGSNYGKKINQYIVDNNLSENVLITGFVSDEDYKNWINLSDVAIQLRKFSRGETSYTVLDCMSSGLPVIVNSVGTLSELPENCKITVQDNDIETSLSKVLVKILSGEIALSDIGENAYKYIDAYHSFELTGKIIFQAALDNHPNLIKREEIKKLYFNEIEFLNKVESKDDLISYSYLITSDRVNLNDNRRRILIDVSGLDFKIQKTGIERLSFHFIEQLIQSDEFIITPYTQTNTKDLFYSAYGKFAVHINNYPDLEHKITFNSNDIILIVHANQSILEANEVYRHLKSQGTKFIFFVYDILPISHPQFFPNFVKEFYKNYISVIEDLADLIVTDSLTTLNEITSLTNVDKESVIVHKYYPNKLVKLPSLAKRIKINLKLVKLPRPLILLVGTVEPRKGYLELLKEIKKLNIDLSFIVVGKEGWKNVDRSERIEILKTIEGLNSCRNVKWFANADDETLTYLYSICDFYLSTSYAEGLGLPLLEANYFDIPIHARENSINLEILGKSNNLYTDLGEALIQIKSDYHNHKKRVGNNHEVYYQQSEEDNLMEIVNRIKNIGVRRLNG